jgi:signal transduction histidine kinase
MSQEARQPSALPAEAVAASVRTSIAADRTSIPGVVEMVNHHVRTPLTVLLGYAELLIESELELPAEVHQSLARIMSAGTRLSDVIVGICEMVDVACVDSNTVDTVDVSGLVIEEIAAWRVRAARQGVRVVASVDQSATCVADSTRLRRALRELLDNALAFAPDHSTVGVAAVVAGTAIRIEVSDQGRGIDMTDRERLVLPFERATHPRQSTAGLGIGLALASVVAAAHGGRLVLTENPGGGLLACLELPTDFTTVAHATVAPWAGVRAAWTFGPLRAASSGGAGAQRER